MTFDGDYKERFGGLSQLFSCHSVRSLNFAHVAHHTVFRVLFMKLAL